MDDLPVEVVTQILLFVGPGLTRWDVVCHLWRAVRVGNHRKLETRFEASVRAGTEPQQEILRSGRNWGHPGPPRTLPGSILTLVRALVLGIEVWRDTRAPSFSDLHRQVLKRRLAFLFGEAARRGLWWIHTALAAFKGSAPPGTRPETIKVFRQIPKSWMVRAFAKATCRDGQPEDLTRVPSYYGNQIEPNVVFRYAAKFRRLDVAVYVLTRRAKQKPERQAPQAMFAVALTEFAKHALLQDLFLALAVWAGEPAAPVFMPEFIESFVAERKRFRQHPVPSAQPSLPFEAL